MADIRVTHSDRVFYRVDDCVAALLVEALPSIFERVKPPAPPAPVTAPRFYSAPSPHTGAAGLYVQLPGGENRSVFGDIARKRAQDALSAGPIPDNVWEQFEGKRAREKQSGQ